MLKPGGRLVVVVFHSLEDRIVKTFLASRGRRAGSRAICRRRRSAAPTFRILTDGRSSPDEAEIAPIRARVRPSCAPPSAPTLPAAR